MKCPTSGVRPIPDVSQVAEQHSKLYQLLQASVDKEIEHVGFLPDATKYGMNGSHANGNGHHQPQSQNNDSGISEKQLDLINRLVRDNNINKTEVENTPDSEVRPAMRRYFLAKLMGIRTI